MAFPFAQVWASPLHRRLRTTVPPSVAPRPASTQLRWPQAGVGLPEEDLHLLEQNALASAHARDKRGHDARPISLERSPSSCQPGSYQTAELAAIGRTC